MLTVTDQATLTTWTEDNDAQQRVWERLKPLLNNTAKSSDHSAQVAFTFGALLGYTLDGKTPTAGQTVLNREQELWAMVPLDTYPTKDAFIHAIEDLNMAYANAKKQEKTPRPAIGRDKVALPAMPSPTLDATFPRDADGMPLPGSEAKPTNEIEREEINKFQGHWVKEGISASEQASVIDVNAIDWTNTEERSEAYHVMGHYQKGKNAAFECIRQVCKELNIPVADGVKALGVERPSQFGNWNDPQTTDRAIAAIHAWDAMRKAAPPTDPEPATDVDTDIENRAEHEAADIARVNAPAPIHVKGQSEIAIDRALAVTDNSQYSRDLAYARYGQALVAGMHNQGIMIAGIDYGTVPGVEKPSLLKPGAEKLARVFHYCPIPQALDAVIDWDKGLIFYRYQMSLVDIETGKTIAVAEGLCSSKEEKYGVRWVTADKVPAHINKATLQTRDDTFTEPEFAIDAAVTTGKYGHPKDYWAQFKLAIAAGTATKGSRDKKGGGSYTTWTIGGTKYALPNDKVFDQANTICKMAQKRALVAVVLIGCNASGIYTQDVEEMSQFGYIDAEVVE